MASKGKRSFKVKQFWKRLRAKKGSLLPGLFLRAGHLLELARLKIKGWPRFWKTGLLYLLVLLLAGGVYYWRTSQLRTINPYIEKIDFEKPEEKEPPKSSDNGLEQNRLDEPVTVPAKGSAKPLADKTEPEPSFVWPVTGRSIILEYGASAVEALARLDRAVKWSFYRGLGIIASPGEKVCSIGRGKVKEVNETGKPYGKEIIIEHDNLTVYYGALERVDVKEGDRVAGGEPIATVKNNPEGGEVYLYLEMLENGRAVDPLTILPGS